MTWITDDDLKAVLASTLGLGAAADLPAFWGPLVARGNAAGYNFVRAALSANGYTPAQMDLWDDRETWNVRAGLYFALELANLDDERAAAQLDRLWERLQALAKVLVTVGGDNVNPAGRQQVSTGAYDTAADRHALDDVL